MASWGRETVEERKMLYILVVMMATHFLLLEQGVPHLHFALGPTDHEPYSERECYTITWRTVRILGGVKNGAFNVIYHIMHWTGWGSLYFVRRGEWRFITLRSLKFLLKSDKGWHWIQYEQLTICGSILNLYMVIIWANCWFISQLQTLESLSWSCSLLTSLRALFLLRSP